MDVILGALLVNGNDAFRSGKKLGNGYRQVGELSAYELREYLSPFIGNVRRFPGTKAVVLHDGLPDAVTRELTTPWLTFERVAVATDHANYERRFFAFREWLAANPGVGRAWVVDVNDVAFTRDPFAWLSEFAADRLAVGDEWTPYRGNEWFAGCLRHLPPEYGDRLVGEYGDRCPLNCGAFGGDRGRVLAALTATTAELTKIGGFLRKTPPPYPIVYDMTAFGYALLGDPAVVTFKMDGGTVSDGVPSPLVHDRKPALEVTRDSDDMPASLLATLRHTQRLEGWCWDEKAEAVARLVLDARPQLAVEVGVFGGRFLLAVAAAMKHNGRGVVYGVDPWYRAPSLEGYQFGPNTDGQAWTDEHLTRVYVECVTAAAALKLLPHTRFLCGRSERVHTEFAKESVDLLHVDGNHAVEPAVRDVRNYLPLVRRGGFVFVDDTNWESVQPAVAEVEAECDIVHDAGAWRLYRKR